MNKQDYKIHIIGAGISGLIAAQVLEDHGFIPTIIEATNTVGGRVKTDIIDNYSLDHGFQVLLTAYPAAQKYLDFKALNLEYFLPGAVIFKNEKQVTIGDPLRNLLLLIPTLTAGIGTFNDKLKILKLNKLLKNKSLEAIFSTKETTTLKYLKAFGFTEPIITNFFKPFFSGIFLEDTLETSSRMFEFVYKMFGEGYAALPKKGIGEIPRQLQSKLTKTTFKFNTKVAAINNNKIELENKETINSDFVIIATDAGPLISNLKQQTCHWHSCETLYFETNKPVISKNLIGLIPKQNSLINNIYYHTNKADKNLLSVTVVNHQDLSNSTLVEQVEQELEKYCNIKTNRFIKQYSIPMALPKLNGLEYEMSPSETRLKTNVFLAGDTLLNGSLNAAMISGERAALGVIETITEHKS